MHKNKDGNLVNFDRGKHVLRNNETINIKICLKKKKWTDPFRERYSSLFFFWSQPRFKGLITRRGMTWLVEISIRATKNIFKFRIYENHTRDPRSEELNEGDDHPSFNSSLRGSHI